MKLVFGELKQTILVMNFVFLYSNQCVPLHIIPSVHQLDYLCLHTHTSVHVYANA